MRVRISHFLGSLKARWRDGTVAERTAFVVTGILVVLGVWFRSRAVMTAPMWLDEASWTIRLLNDPLQELIIRPLGFMIVERALARTFAPSEAVLRFLPWLAGVACTVMSVPLARRLFRSEASRLLFVGLIALDPSAIELSKEFKPYSVSLTVHATLLFLSLRYGTSGKARDLALLLSVSLLGVLFAQDAVFAYPGIFLLLAIDTLRARRVRHFVATMSVSALLMAVIGLLYVFCWSQMTSKDEDKWGKKYDVFYMSGGTKTDWVLGRYSDLVQTPALRRNTWTTKRLSPKALGELGALYGAAFLLLNLAGAWQLLRGNKWRQCALILLPLGVMLTFNLLNFWPFGPFRANLFTLLYIAALGGAAVDRDALKVNAFDFAPVALLILLPLLGFERTWHATKTRKASSLFPDAMRALIRLHGPVDPNHKDILVADGYTCPMYRYYVKYHPVTSKTLGPELLERFKLDCHSDRIAGMVNIIRRSLNAPGDRAFMIVSKAEYFDRLPQPSGDVHQFAAVNVGGLHHIIGFDKPAPPAEEPQDPAGP